MSEKHTNGFSLATVDLSDRAKWNLLREQMLDDAAKRIHEQVAKLQALGVIDQDGNLLHPEDIPADMRPDSQCSLD